MGLCAIEAPYMGVGRNLLYEKEHFQKFANFKKFKNHQGGDDDILIQDLLVPEKTGYTLATYTLSKPKTTTRSYLRQKIRHLNSGKKYPLRIKSILFMLLFSHCIVFYLGVIAVLDPSYRLFILLTFLLRVIVILTNFNTLGKEAEYPISKRAILLGDVIFPVYFPLLGFFSIILKTVRWK